MDANYSSAARSDAIKGNYHAIVAGHNYGQGSSREHAAIAPQYLGLRLVIAKSFARLHGQNLINSSVLPLVFCDERDWERLHTGDRLVVENVHQLLYEGISDILLTVSNKNITIPLELAASERQRHILLAGGYINWIKKKHGYQSS